MQPKINRVARLFVSAGPFVLAGMAMMAQGPGSGNAQGAEQFATICASCHGSDGTGGKAPSLLAPNIIALSDAELIKVVHDGTAAGMPSFAGLGDANIAAVVRYLRTLQGQGGTAGAEAVTGDAAAGRALYFGKAECASCHMIQGKGGFIASDLTAYGRSHGAKAIAEAIVKPDNPPESRVVEVRTKSGVKLSGVVRNEDNFNIVLQTEDGRFHFLSRSDLADVHTTDHSLMPEDYGARLTPEELNNIVSFLIVAGRTTPAEPEPARRRRGGGH
jgi:cytochrome c oxidase cbb3-type subunit III